MGRTSSMSPCQPCQACWVGIVGGAPAADEKVLCFFVCLFFVTLSNDKVCDNGDAIRSSAIFKTIMAPLHRGRLVVVHLYSSFSIRTFLDFPLQEYLY